MEDTGLFARTELIRALVAPRATFTDAGDRREAASAGAEARRNVGFFRVGQFNVCELRSLLAPALYDDAVKLIADTHPGQEVACAPGEPRSSSRGG